MKKPRLQKSHASVTFREETGTSLVLYILTSLLVQQLYKQHFVTGTFRIELYITPFLAGIGHKKFTIFFLSQIVFTCLQNEENFKNMADLIHLTK